MDNLAFMGQPLTGLRGTYNGFPPAVVTIGRWHSICGSIIITYMDNVVFFNNSQHLQNCTLCKAQTFELPSKTFFLVPFKNYN